MIKMHGAHTCFLSLIFLLSSCARYFFSEPQPVDAKNLYVFPKKFRGSWVMDRDTLIIGKDFYLMPKYEPVKISLSSGKVIKRHTRMGFGFTSQTDSSEKNNLKETHTPIGYIEEVDTSFHFVINKNKVYEIKENQLSKGFTFTQKGDTLYYTHIERKPIILGSYIFLRKISTNQFIFNFREEKENWWTVSLLEITPDGFILLKGQGKNFFQYAEPIYSHSESFYFDMPFPKDQMIDLLSKDVFSEEHIKLEIKSKIKPK